ncbi:MAG: GNAT family N-acetyltransferase [Alphaproteobacteria bacterium]|nr:GNAT family N-acetyltransferase [Alphaproteobacteria bacterium]
MDVRIRPITGPELVDVLPGLARLRIEIFSGWPYLYEGDLHYETNYLREFSRAPDAIVVAALDGDDLIGAATASPMQAQSETFRAPFETRGIDTARLFYFGESVLYPEYRGRKIGHAFFDHREAQARKCGATAATFAAVLRPETHPKKPEGYAPLDAFWMKRGYRPVANMTTQLAWPEQGESEASVKTMQYWRRDL